MLPSGRLGMRLRLTMSLRDLPRACRTAQVKSYLAGNPGIALALNDSLAIGRREGSTGQGAYGGRGMGADAVMLDDCNFHQSVSLDRCGRTGSLHIPVLLQDPSGSPSRSTGAGALSLPPPLTCIKALAPCSGMQWTNRQVAALLSLLPWPASMPSGMQWNAVGHQGRATTVKRAV